MKRLTQVQLRIWRAVLEGVNDSNLWLSAQRAADLVSHSLCPGLPEVPGVGRLCHQHHCLGALSSGDRAEVHIEMGMKGLSWPQSKELRWEGLLSLNEDKLLWIMAMLQLMHLGQNTHTLYIPTLCVCPFIFVLTARGKEMIVCTRIPAFIMKQQHSRINTFVTSKRNQNKKRRKQSQ